MLGEVGGVTQPPLASLPLREGDAAGVQDHQHQSSAPTGGRDPEDEQMTLQRDPCAGAGIQDLWCCSSSAMSGFIGEIGVHLAN